jgi:hypothetical protein
MPSSRASPLPQELGTSARNWAAVRPPSSERRPEQARSHRRAKAERRTPAAPHHSSGRALARLQLLILIHPPPRQAEWRCSSGDGRAAPFGAAELIACRSREADRSAMPPDEYRSEGTPSPSEGPYVRGERFFCLLFLRRLLKKVSRRKGETIGGRYRRNGYVHHQNTLRPTQSHREQARSHSRSGTPAKYRSVTAQ